MRCADPKIRRESHDVDRAQCVCNCWNRHCFTASRTCRGHGRASEDSRVQFASTHRPTVVACALCPLSSCVCRSWASKSCLAPDSRPLLPYRTRGLYTHVNLSNALLLRFECALCAKWQTSNRADAMLGSTDCIVTSLLCSG